MSLLNLVSDLKVGDKFNTLDLDGKEITYRVQCYAAWNNASPVGKKWKRTSNRELGDYILLRLISTNKKVEQNIDLPRYICTADGVDYIQITLKNGTTKEPWK